jgi:hypothetical protein
VGSSVFQAIELIPPAIDGAKWRVALSGASHIGLPGSLGNGDGLQSSFAVIAEIGSGITGGSGSTRVKPLTLFEDFGDTNLGGFPAAAHVPGVGVLFAGSNDYYKLSTSPFPIAGVLDLMDYDLNFKFDTDAERGSFFPVANQYYFLGGYTETNVDKVRLLDDGGFMVVGSIQDPWDPSLLTTPRTPSETIDGNFDFAVHGLLVRTNSAGLNRTYKSFGHPAAGHIVNTKLKDGWQTTDRGFVAAGIACPGPAIGCLMTPYVVKTSPDMSSAGLTCGCDNGYEDCGEAQHGWKSENSIRPGDCGGTSSCAACPIDCTNGVQDADEDGPDCGGACALDRFSRQPHECACFDSDCTDARECNKPTCNPNVGGGCEFRPDPDQNGQPCSTGVCQNGTCASQCVPANCDDNDDCTDDVCDPHAGCQHNATDCDDGNDCTVDSCKSNGGCQHSGRSCDDGEECTTDGCNPSTGECTTSPADNGTTCGDNQVCLKGKCSTPYYVDTVQKILGDRCGGCHGGPLGTCRGGVCLALCYDEATKSPFNCRLDMRWTNAHDCLDNLMQSGLMPQAGIDCSIEPGHTDGCPSQLELNIIDSWNKHNHPATSDNSTPPGCDGAL